jgi:hypothetical protein
MTFGTTYVYRVRDLAADIKWRKLEWLEYAVRMNQIRLPKNVLLRKGRRQKKKTERPRLIWLENIENDLRELKRRLGAGRQVIMRVGICPKRGQDFLEESRAKA